MRTKTKIVWRRVGDDSLVLLDLETGRYNSLNRSAAIIWGAVVGGEGVPGCANVLAQNYPGLNISKAHQTVEIFLDRLQKQGLLVDGDPDTEAHTDELDFSATTEFEAPSCEEHEALQQVTAGTYSGSSGGGTYYYYYYYYY